MKSQLDSIIGPEYSSTIYEEYFVRDCHLPYHWDGECHLVLNDHFYVDSPSSPRNEIPDPLEDLDFNIEYEPQYEKMEDSPYYLEEIAASSEASGSTNPSMEIPIIPTYGSTLDEKLDFIMENTNFDI